jgi:guanylate kinase
MQTGKQGKLIVITGPSGVGKGTLVNLLRDRHPQLYLSVSATTRQPRNGEIDGENYYFLSREEFQKAIEDEDFLEWAEYAGNYYGTPRSKVVDRLDRGINVVLEIELLGARQIGSNFPDALRIFILPPSDVELEKRLRSRGTDSEMAINRRLQRAREEIAASDEFDLKIVNDDLETALGELEKAILS